MPYNSLSEIDAIYNKQLQYTLEARNLSVAKRVAFLKKLLAKIRAEEQAIEKALYDDFHKSAIESGITEILAVEMELKHIIKHLPKWAKDKSVAWSPMFANNKAYLHYEPKGNVLIMTPWNYPFQLPMVHLAASIAAGNTSILKLSEFAEHTNQVIRKIIGEVFSEAHVAVVEGAVEESSHLLALRFDHIHFTGSPAVGKIVMEAASKHLADITLELGGKSPAIVDKHVNIRRVVKNLIWAKYVNAGQTCIAPDYLFVHRHIRGEFESIFREELIEAFGRDALNSPDYARIINKKHFDRLTSALESAKSLGAQVLAGGNYLEKELYIEPTLISNVAENNTLMQEEIFGPIFPVCYYSQIDEVLASIRKKEKPLALYVFSKDNLFNKHVIRYSSAGSTCVNDALIQIMHPNLPFGGVNNSGIGQSTGKYGFKAFSHERAVAKSIGYPLSAMFWYPYTEKTQRFLQLIRKLF